MLRFLVCLSVLLLVGGWTRPSYLKYIPQSSQTVEHHDNYEAIISNKAYFTVKVVPSNPEPDNNRLSFLIILSNNSAHPITCSTDNITLTDDAGNNYKVFTYEEYFQTRHSTEMAAWMHGLLLQKQTIAPGERCKGIVQTEQPTDQTNQVINMTVSLPNEQHAFKFIVQ